MARVKGRGARLRASKTASPMKFEPYDRNDDDDRSPEPGPSDSTGLRRSTRQQQLRQAAAVAAAENNEEPHSMDEDTESTRPKRRYRKRHASSGQDDGDEVSSRRKTSRRQAMLKDQDANRYALNWIRQCYEYREDHNVPRSGMFEHYRVSSIACNLPVVNAATFGKLIRHVFPNITTRRLGTRGQSKYHYCGIRRRPSTAGFLQTNPAYLASAPLPTQEPQQERSHIQRSLVSTTAQEPLQTEAESSVSHQNYESVSLADLRSSQASSQLEDRRTYIHFEPVDVRLPSFSMIVQTGIEFQDTDAVIDFANAYESHCYSILHNLQSGRVNIAMNDLVEFYDTLPQQTRRLLANEPNLLDSIWRWDCALYDAIILSLIPSMCATLPFEIIRASRQYTNQLVKHLVEALAKYPEELRDKKVQAANVFVSKFCRHLKLNQMAQSTATMLRRSDIVETMRTDWEQIDFDNILDETRWVCACNMNFVDKLLREEFPSLLHPGASVETFVAWIEDVVKKCLPRPTSPLTDADTNEATQTYLSKAKQIILQWNMYVTLAMKDLATSGAPTTDHFRTLRLFLDDYLLYFVEATIANCSLSGDDIQGAPALETSPTSSRMRGGGKDTQRTESSATQTTTDDMSMEDISNDTQG